MTGSHPTDEVNPDAQHVTVPEPAQHFPWPDVISLNIGWFAYSVGLMNPTVPSPLACRKELISVTKTNTDTKIAATKYDSMNSYQMMNSHNLTLRREEGSTCTGAILVVKAASDTNYVFGADIRYIRIRSSIAVESRCRSRRFEKRADCSLLPRWSREYCGKASARRNYVTQLALHDTGREVSHMHSRMPTSCY